MPIRALENLNEWRKRDRKKREINTAENTLEKLPQYIIEVFFVPKMCINVPSYFISYRENELCRRKAIPM